MFVHPATMKAPGFGLFSWNVITLLVPPDGFFGFKGDVTRDATGGQYEGEAYVGRGVILLLVVAFAWAPRKILECVRVYWVFCTTLLALAVYRHPIAFMRQTGF